MMNYSRRFNIFAEKKLDAYLQNKLDQMRAEVENGEDDYILNVNETEYITYLTGRYTVRNLDLKFDDVFVSTYEKEIPSERFPKTFLTTRLEPGRRHKRDAIKYHIPFVGDPELFGCVPNPRISWYTEITLEDGCVCFEVINFYSDADRIKEEAESKMSPIRQQLSHVANQVASYNSSLESHARNVFLSRKQHLLSKHALLSSLGVPIKKRGDLPQTFAIPTPQTTKKIRITKPLVTEKGYKPEPTLDQPIYEAILQVIHDLGKQFERMPSTYGSKSEEELRDHFLLYLEPRFEGSATGETFNKSGKTDILLRYKNSNVFIAECKFWKGGKSFLKTITQLLGYLTWRDSKAAVVMFVPNKEFSPVIKTVEEVTPKHSNYLRFVNKKDESWLNYRLHINGDPNREVKLAVLLFHFPR